MSFQLVESGKKTSRTLGGTAVSITLHTLLIALAVAATANARTRSRVEWESATTVRFVAPRPVGPDPSTLKHKQLSVAPAGSPVLSVSGVVAPVWIPVTLADPDTPVGEEAPITSGTTELNVGGRETAAITGTSLQPLTELEVDRPVRMILATGSPAYPETLRALGVEGEVVARYVVAGNGRVDMQTFEVLSETHAQFTHAVRIALCRARFQPAQAGGRNVAQLVEQRFQFRLDR